MIDAEDGNHFIKVRNNKLILKTVFLTPGYRGPYCEKAPETHAHIKKLLPHKNKSFRPACNKVRVPPTTRCKRKSIFKIAFSTSQPTTFFRNTTVFEDQTSILGTV